MPARSAPAPRSCQPCLAQCDLVFTSFDRGAWQGHAAGLAIPEALVHVTTSSYGTTGPYAAWRGGSLADWAAGGYLYITGDPDREPLSGPENTCAYAAGYTAAFGAEAALIGRMRDGRAAGISTSRRWNRCCCSTSRPSRAARRASCGGGPAAIPKSIR